MSNPLDEYKPAKLLLEPCGGGAGKPSAAGLKGLPGCAAGGRFIASEGSLYAALGVGLMLMTDEPYGA